MSNEKRIKALEEKANEQASTILLLKLALKAMTDNLTVIAENQNRGLNTFEKVVDKLKSKNLI